jgi:hypothetical protein
MKYSPTYATTSTCLKPEALPHSFQWHKGPPIGDLWDHVRRRCHGNLGFPGVTLLSDE